MKFRIGKEFHLDALENPDDPEDVAIVLTTPDDRLEIELPFSALVGLAFALQGAISKKARQGIYLRHPSQN